MSYEMQHRSRHTAHIIKLALAHSDEGIPYDRLVNIIARNIEPERARAYRLSRLKRTPSETPAETLWKGSQALARKYIDAAHRYGRITYFEPSATTRGSRRVFPGDPASTGGRHAKPQAWTNAEREGSGPSS